MSTQQHQTNQPFPNLITSQACSRPTSLKAYFVLIQHSLQFENRFLAASHTIISDNKATSGSSSGTSLISNRSNGNNNNNSSKNSTSLEKEIYKRAGLMEPGEVAQTCNSAGFLLVQDTFHKLCQKYNGKVIFISVIGNFFTQIPRVKEDEEHIISSSFCKNGLIIDLASDPLGWDSDSEETETEEIQSDQNLLNCRVRKCKLSDLRLLLRTIQSNAKSLMVENDGENRFEETTNNDDDSKEIPPNSSSSSIPIIFDSISPLLLAHGIHPTMKFLEALQIGHQSYPQQFHSSNENSSNNNEKLPQLSPMIVPTLSETFLPSHHRLLEDKADALVHVSSKDGNLIILRKSARGTGKVSKETQSFSIAHHKRENVLSSSSKTFMNATSVGRKNHPSHYDGIHSYIKFTNNNIKNSENDQSESNAKMKGSLETNNNKSSDKKTNSDQNEGLDSVTFRLGQLSTAEKTATRDSIRQPFQNDGINNTNNNKKNKITLKMEDDEEGRKEESSTQEKKSGPRIYMDDDDPEFDDLDEEDPDDDLDL